jgi:hypothetical protein
MSTAQIQLNVAVPSELREQLHEVARANDRSLAGEVRRVLREHVERESAAVAAR